MNGSIVRALAGAALLAATTPQLASSQTAADSAAVRRAVLDYVEGFYEGDTAKLVRSVRPDVLKLGFGRRGDSREWIETRMPWENFLEYARDVREENEQAPAGAPKVVELLDMGAVTASAKLTAFWGTDYLLVGKFGDRWMISHVLWQSPPPSARMR